MEYRRLGATGLSVSAICLGTSRFAREIDGEVQTTRAEALDLLDAFADGGGNFLDTAEIYGDPNGTSERWIGEWLDGRDRESFVIASKVAGPGGGDPNRSGASRKRVRAAIEGTLDRLGTGYLDLYYVHWWDEGTPIGETLSALDGLVREGRVHYLGLSNVAAWQLGKALRASDVNDLEPVSVLQPRYNAAFCEKPAGNLAVCERESVAVCPYAGLERGFLTGKYERGTDGEVIAPEDSRGDLRGWEGFEDRQWRVLDAVRSVAAEIDATPAQVALRWLIDREAFACVPIVAARSRAQMAENLGAVDVELAPAQRRRITEAYD